MRVYLLIILAVCIVGCATYPNDQFCKLSDDQISILMKNLAELQKELNTEYIKYKPFITSEGHIFKQDEVCWVKLSPTDIRLEYGVYDGGIAVNINMNDMSLGDVSEIKY